MGAIFGAGIDDFAVFFVLSLLAYCCLCCACRCLMAACCHHHNKRRRRGHSNIVSSTAELPHPTASAVIVKHDPSEIAQAWVLNDFEEEEEVEKEENGNERKEQRKKKTPSHTISWHDDEENLVAINVYDDIERALPLQECVVHSSSRRHNQGFIPRELQRRLGEDRFMHLP